MKVLLFASLILLVACQHAPVRCDRHLVPINPVTKTPRASVSRPSAQHP